MKIIRHILIVVSAVLLLVGIPVIASGYPSRLFSGADAIASATVILDQPSGEYVVLINKNMHTDEENLSVWQDFFSGEEIGFLFEDISCMVAGSDRPGLELARSFQSRLPENQMEIKEEDMKLMLSKAYAGRFDIILMSKEAFDTVSAGMLIDYDNTLVIESGAESEASPAGEALKPLKAGAGSPDQRSGAESEGL